MRLNFTFVGTTCQDVSLDPGEFAGQSVPQITDEIKRVLAEIRPDVSFFEDDVVLAAEQLIGVDNRPNETPGV